MSNAQNSLTSRKNQSPEDEAVTNALLTRIRFSRSWTDAMRFLTARKLNDAKKALTTTKTLLEIIASSTGVGECPQHIFQPEISKRLEIQTNPRKIALLPFEDAIIYFRKMVSIYYYFFIFLFSNFLD